MAGVPDELLLARIRKEAAAREAAVNGLYAALETANAAMQEKITAAASKLAANINGRSVNSSAIAGVILRSQVEPGFALAEELTTLEAKVTDGQNTSAASIEEIRTTVATQYDATAQQILTIQANFNNTSARFQEQITTNANATTAVAARTTTLESTVNNPTTGVVANYARIVAEETTRATQTSALATRTSTLESQVQTPTTGLIARVSTVESTKVDASGAYAQANSAISASLSSGSSGTIGAAVTSEATARADADTALGTNLYGRYTLQVTAGNVVTGMEITSSSGGTPVSDITFQAAAFKIYNGVSTGTAPFTVSGGVVYMDNAVVRSSLNVGISDNNTQITGSGLSVGNSSAGIVLNGSSNTNYINIGAGRSYTVAISGGNSVGAITLSSSGYSASLFNGACQVYDSSYGTAYYRAYGMSGPIGSLQVDSSGRWAITAGSGRSVVVNTSGTDRFFFGTDGNFKTTGGDIRKTTSDGWTPVLFDGDNAISFQWDGSNFKVKIDTSVFTLI